MDKTRNKIFVGCLALLLVMVAGYALFSQNLNITGTAKAEGGFSVTATCEKGIPSNLLESAKAHLTANDVTWVDENAYYDDSCTVNGNNINYQASFKYPGARRYFVVKVKNTGSITAIPSYDYHNDSGEICKDNNGNDVYDSDECYTDSLSLQIGASALDFLATYDMPFAIEDTDGTVYSTTNMTEEQTAKFFTEDGDPKLDAGVSAYYLTGFGINSLYGTDTGGKIMMKMSLQSKITFSQPSA